MVYTFFNKKRQDKPEYQVLKPRPEESYPDSKGRTKHPGYQKYQERVQSLGFYTSVRMLEKAGFRLPDEAQAKWDRIREQHASSALQVTCEDRSDADVSAKEESGADVNNAAAEISSRSESGAEPSSKEESDGGNSILHTNLSGRQRRERGSLNGSNSALQRKAKKAKVAASSDTESPTAMSSAAPADPPQHTEQLLDKIRSIKEMLPEYGEGFLAACLRAGGYVVHSVVDQLLDESWRQVPELRKLDPKMPLQPPSGKRRRKAAVDKQRELPGSDTAAEDKAAPDATAPAGSAELPETPDQTKEDIQCAVWQRHAAPGVAAPPGSAPSARGQSAHGVWPSAREQDTQDCTKEETPRAAAQRGAAPSAHGQAAPGAPGDLPRSAARLTQPTPDQDGEGAPPAAPQPDQAMCRAGPAERAGPSALDQAAVSGIDASHLPAAQSTESHQQGRIGQAGEIVDLSGHVGTAFVVASDLGQSGANLGSVDLTPDSPRASCATQLPAALSNLNVIQGDKGERSFGPAPDQAQYMPATAAMLPRAFAYPLATPAASRAAACSLDDAIADLSTMKAAWDAGAAPAGRRFGFDAVLQCLHSARMREGLAQQQEATISRLRADASALEQEKGAVIGELRARADALEEELVIMKRCAEKSESMIASKNREILALRSQVDVYEAS